jgi:hypothetical protein
LLTAFTFPPETGFSVYVRPLTTVNAIDIVVELELVVETKTGAAGRVEYVITVGTDDPLALIAVRLNTYSVPSYRFVKAIGLVDTLLTVFTFPPETGVSVYVSPLTTVNAIDIVVELELEVETPDGAAGSVRADVALELAE